MELWTYADQKKGVWEKQGEEGGVPINFGDKAMIAEIKLYSYGSWAAHQDVKNEIHNLSPLYEKNTSGCTGHCPLDLDTALISCESTSGSSGVFFFVWPRGTWSSGSCM